MESKNEKNSAEDFFPGRIWALRSCWGKGRWIIGSDPECDVILSDDGIAPHHVTLVVSDDRIDLVDINGDVSVDGERVEGEEARVKPIQMVTIGATHFALGPPGENMAQCPASGGPAP